jgi:hypothetical protein
VTRSRRARAAVVAVVVTCLAGSGCTAVTAGHGVARTAPAGSASPSPSGSAASSPSVTPGPSGTGTADCPASYAQPDPHRPKVDLDFTVAPDLTVVHGTEHISFTPDLPITELIFRLTANTAPTVGLGNQVVVDSARADHGAGPATYTVSGAASGTQGGLLHIPFGRRLAAGTTVTADLAFTVTLGERSFDRFGRTGDGAERYAWFGSAQPLLAWERGFGWHAEDLIQFTAESATSEAMDTTLRVTAPAADTVLMSGDPAAPLLAGSTRTWQATIATARDVSVAVGPFSVADTTVGGVRLRVGAYSSRQRDQLVPEFRRAITELAARFGPYPFPSLTVARVPAEGGGIEYPSSILMLDGSRLVAVHETAHQWFYAMVGDSQALHPWLDEAFATYAEELVNGDPEAPGTLQAPGAVDRSTESYGGRVNDYYFVTYSKGAAALAEARAKGGAARWDAAVRCYVAKNAWRIANPKDFAAAIAGLPASVAVLRQAGALP